MTREEHYRRAEEFIDALDKTDEAIREKGGIIDPYAVAQINASREYLMECAKIHAIMAGVSVEVFEG